MNLDLFSYYRYHKKVNRYFLIPLLALLFSCALKDIAPEKEAHKSEVLLEKEAKRYSRIPKKPAEPIIVEKGEEDKVIQKTETIDNVKQRETTDILLAVISSDYIDKTYSLYISVYEDNSIAAIKTLNNKKNKVKIYPVDLLHQNIVLVKAASIPLITLRCKDFDPLLGCPIEIKYPSNVALASFSYFDAEIRKENNQWGLFADTQRFTKMNLLARKFLGVLIGIKRIETSL